MTLETREAVLLGQVLAGRVAEDAGIRALAIKGPVLTLQGLRGEHESADVDIWVDPGRVDDFVAALGAVGWFLGHEMSLPAIVPRHSVMMRHPAWPVEIDVHDRFPGFLADPQLVFDELWSRRTTVVLAEVELPTCDPVAHAAVVALHHLRSPARGSTNRSLAQLSVDLRRTVGSSGVADLVGLATVTQSAATLAPFLDLVEAPRPQSGVPASPDDLTGWALVTSDAGSVPWVVEFIRTPWYRWPAFVWHAVMLSDEEIDAFHTPPLGQESRARLRARRLRRGVRQLPSSLAAVARAWLHQHLTRGTRR